MDDLISRQAAIDAIKNYWKNEVDRIPKESTDFDVFTQIIDSILSHNAGICKAIDTLPPAQPKHGRWIKMTGMMPPEYHGHYECSECQWHMKGIRSSWMKEEEYNYCPNCGARMNQEDGDEID